jgi:hypothetical protein
MKGVAQVVQPAIGGLGAMVAWPALLRKLAPTDPSYRTRGARVAASGRTIKGRVK